MNMHNPTPSLSDLDKQVTDCQTACLGAADRAVDERLQTRLCSLAGQVGDMRLRVEDYMHAGKPVAASTITSLTQQASGATDAMNNAKGDQSLYQAMSPVQQLCGAIQQDLPALP